LWSNNLPSDANGNYSLPDGYLAVTGETILASQHNPPLEDLAESMSQRLMASGAKPMSGPLKAADGSAAAPALSFNNATSTGIFKTTNGLGFAVGGVQVAELIAGGFKTGARYIGEVFDWTGSSAPALCVLPYGQTLSRTTYADLWAFAQVEIAAGNTLYNNGNGSTTFGIPDMRGRVRATKDNMGGSAASRLTSTTITADGNTLGAAGGAQTVTLVANQIPTITSVNASQAITVFPAGNAGLYVPTNINGINSQASTLTGGVSHVAYHPTNAFTQSNTFSGNNSISVTYTNGAQQAVANVQPTIITNCALFAGA
jgi:microcystin-dependent protein